MKALMSSTVGRQFCSTVRMMMARVEVRVGVSVRVRVNVTVVRVPVQVGGEVSIDVVSSISQGHARTDDCDKVWRHDGFVHAHQRHPHLPECQILRHEITHTQKHKNKSKITQYEYVLHTFTH